MRTVEQTGRFRRDLRRVVKGRHGVGLEPLLERIVDGLARDVRLHPRWRDHALTGNWVDHRDCHLRPDLVLIYRYLGDDRLQLVRLGSHSELDL